MRDVLYFHPVCGMDDAGGNFGSLVDTVLTVPDAVFVIFVAFLESGLFLVPS